jgi:carboxymethylenebutenolidase
VRALRVLLASLPAVALAATAGAQAADPHAGHAAQEAAAPAATPQPTPPDASLPPSEVWAKSALESSPRHGEWVDVAYGGGPALRSYVVYPERKDKAGVVIVIHEIYGLTDWIRSVADQLAEEGFVAVAPDLLSGLGPGGGGSDSVGSRDDVVKLVRGLAADEADRRLDAVRAWAIALPAANGKSATVGYCWGGSRSFGYAAHQPALDAAVVYYGTAPSQAGALDNLKAPVLGLYGGDDARVGATIEATKTEMQRLGRRYDVHVFEGAGHGFLRNQEGRDGANLKATREAWPLTLALLRERLGS